MTWSIYRPVAGERLAYIFAPKRFKCLNLSIRTQIEKKLDRLFDHGSIGDMRPQNLHLALLRGLTIKTLPIV